MSTRSHIGIWNEDGSLDVIYCHWDGYPSYNGALLLHRYQDPEKIRELIALGDISSLAESVKPAEGEHTFESPQLRVMPDVLHKKKEVANGGLPFLVHHTEIRTHAPAEPPVIALWHGLRHSRVNHVRAMDGQIRFC